MSDNIEYPPCRKCGASHGMGVEDMETGEITPMDICYKCLWSSECKPMESQIKFDDKKFREYYRSFITHLKEIDGDK